MKQILKKPDEWDLTTGWKHVMAYMHKPGIKHAIKRRLARRRRHEARHRIRTGEQQ